jgi:hypothetical protein
MAAELTVGVDVSAPQQRVWDALVDWPRQGEWMPATAVRVVAGGGQGVGGRIAAWTGVGPVRVLDRMTITEWQPPRRCAVEHTGRVIRGAAWFDVLDLGEGRSRVVWTERLTAPFGLPDAVARLVLRPATGLVIRVGLRRLARRLEGGEQRLRRP